MRSTSSARRLLSFLLSILLAVEWTGLPSYSLAGTVEEPCLLLRFRSPSVPEDEARGWLEPVPDLLKERLRVRWIPSGPPRRNETDPAENFPEPDDAAIERISVKIAEAIRRMDSMDTREAAVLLSEAESLSRRYRSGKALRPYLAEIFLRRGLLSLWEGNRNVAEEMFARSRLLHPGFSPDPAMFSPAFRETWKRSGERPAPDPEILVQSLPAGATVTLNGKPAGVTPGRFKVRSCEPVRIRVSLEGYQDAEKTGQWLPGETESIEWLLSRNRIATLEERLVSSPEGRGTGGLLAELARGTGAARIALLVLDRRNGKTHLKVLSAAGDGGDPDFLGEIQLPPGKGNAPEMAKRASDLLASAGWPSMKLDRMETERPWYHKKWFWILVGAIAVGAAAVASGGSGGGGTGGSTGTINVTF